MVFYIILLHVFEKRNTIGIDQSAINVDDIVETVNHFRCIDLMIEEANAPEDVKAEIPSLIAKMFYYRGLAGWNTERGYLIDTFLIGQNRYKKYLDYFRIKYID